MYIFTRSHGVVRRWYDHWSFHTNLALYQNEATFKSKPNENSCDLYAVFSRAFFPSALPNVISVVARKGLQHSSEDTDPFSLILPSRRGEPLSIFGSNKDGTLHWELL